MLKSNNLLKNAQLQTSTVIITIGAFLVVVSSMLLQLALSAINDSTYTAYAAVLFLPLILTPIIGYFIGTRSALKKTTEKRLNGIFAAYLTIGIYIILDFVAGLLLVIDQYPYSDIAIIKSLATCGAASLISYYIATKAPKKLLITSHSYQLTAITLTIIALAFIALMTVSSITNIALMVFSLIYVIPLFMLALSYAVLDPSLDRISRVTQAATLTAVGITLLGAGVGSMQHITVTSFDMTAYFYVSIIANLIATGIWLAYMWPLIRRRFL